MPRGAQAQARRLLRLLFIRHGSLPTDSGTRKERLLQRLITQAVIERYGIELATFLAVRVAVVMGVELLRSTPLETVSAPFRSGLHRFKVLS